MKIAICDDNIKELEHTYLLAKEYNDKQVSFDIQIIKYDSPIKLIQDVRNGTHFDVFILAILMPQLNGIELAEKLRYTHENSTIIFISKTKSYAFDAFSVDAMQYIIKPISTPLFFRAIDRAVAIHRIEQGITINFNSKCGMVKLYIHNIMYAECVGHTAYLHLVSGEVLQSKTLRYGFTKTVEALLSDKCFIHSHQSYILNMNFIKYMTTHDFEMIDGKLVPIVKARAQALKSVYTNFLIEKSYDT